MNNISKNNTLLSQAIINNCLPLGDIKEIKSLSERREEITQIAKGYLELSCEALEQFTKGHLKKFDALAGDTACQKRALALAEIYEESLKQSHLRLQRLHDVLKEELKNIDISKISDPSLEGEPLLKQILSSSIALNAEDQILINSYILTLTRDCTDRSKTQMANIANKVNSIFLDKIGFKLKESLVNLSVKRVQQQTAELKFADDNMHHSLKNLLGDKNIVAQANLRCTPFTFNVLAILERMRQTEKLTILSLQHRPSGKTIKILLKGHPEKGFVSIKPELHLDRAAVVFDGVSDDDTKDPEQLLQDLLGGSDTLLRYPHSRFMEIILANAAHHPQYTDKTKQIPFFHKDEEKNVMGTTKKALFEQSLQKLNRLTEDSSLSDKLRCVQAHLHEIAGTPQSKQTLKNSLFPGANNMEGIIVFRHMHEGLKQRAEREGFCEENPSGFLVKHVYVNTVADELKPSI